MEMVLRAVLFYLCYSVTLCSESNYKAAVAIGTFRNGLTDFLPQIAEASKQRADITLLSTELPVSEICTDTACGLENYDKLVRAISDAAKKYGVYIVTHLYEKIRCQGSDEIVRSSLVFDRSGSVVSAHRRPLNNYAVCNATGNEMTSFPTDFGVSFLLLMSDDLIAQDVEALRSAKNLIVTGGSNADAAYLRENQLIGSLAYIGNLNVISDSGIFAGRAGLRSDGMVQVLNKEYAVISDRISFGSPSQPEDLSQYNIAPLDLQASGRGHRQTVCHGKLCCDFYVKTKTMGMETYNFNYGLAVFEGIREIGDHILATESCKLVRECKNADKQTCEHNLEDFNIAFDKITITGNFTRPHSTQYPVILTTETSLSSDSFAFVAKPVDDVKQVTVELSDAKNIIKFGILGQDHSKDFNRFSNSTNSEWQNAGDFYEYIFNEEVVEFFDSVWIKLRILLFIVSVYILEMM